jgi:hypothetical protein
MLNDTSWDKNFGPCLYNGYYEHFPMFFTRFGAEINLVGQYHGSSIFMICNGPSLASGKYDLSLLKRPGIVTYGMNNGARTIRPNFWTCVDDPQRFIKSIWLDPTITKVVPFTFAEKPIFDNSQWQVANVRVQDCPNMVYFRRNEKFVANRFLKELTVNWGNHKDHGGGRSVMLAILKISFLLGFRNVFLLGADFKMSETYTYHFDEQRSKGAVNGNMDTYHKLMHQYFPALKPEFEAEDFHVWNCNPDSELKVFDYVPYEDAIAFASKDLGDVDNERTWGMYSKPEERGNWAQEPNNGQKAHLRNIPGRVSTPIYIDRPMRNGPEEPAQPSQPQPAPRRPMPPSVAMNQNRPNRPVPQQNPQVNRPQPRHIDFKNNPHFAGINRQDEQIIGPKVPTPRPMRPESPVPVDNTRIVRNVPCGGGMSFGSSSANPDNITIDDNGR